MFRQKKNKKNLEGDCKVQTLAPEIITPLNECTGETFLGLYTAQT